MWTATDLGVVTFARVQADGVTTTQALSNLSEGEPDPEVFEIPSDYTVVQMPTRLDILSGAASGASRARRAAGNPLSRGTVIPLEPVPAP